MTADVNTLDSLALVGGTVVELDPPRVERADVVIGGDRIVRVEGATSTHAPRIDASGCLVMPALAVGHTHLYSALACGMPAPKLLPRTFVEILERVWWRLDKALDDELVSISASVGALHAARHGAAFVVDHHASPNAVDGSLDRIAAALDAVGLRAALCYETTDRDGRERREAGLRENERFLGRVKAGHTHHRALVGAHASFTLEDDALNGIRDLAGRYGVGVHVHVAEDGTDEDDARRRGTDLSLRLERMGATASGSVLAHGVHLNSPTIERLTEKGAWLVTNARSNMNNAVGLSSARGSRVALGTDGIGADMIAEAQAHFFRHTEARDGIAADALTRVVNAQRLASRLVDGHEHAPRVAAGERADLVVLAYDPPTPMTPANLAGHVLFGWGAANVRDTVVGGRIVVRDRVVQTIDEAAVMARARAAAKRLWERMDEVR
jgi:putative selenium metabolism protein SsnA